ncbi:GerMN domain-containing protein [Patescibacteria group bacterium]|nr:GerMN domain-containing protein [Patescibacteria group bacterium]
MNKKIFIILIIVLLIGISALIIFEKYKTKPIIEEIKKGMVVLSPRAGEEIASPVKITGYVNGDGWIGFEGQVGSVKLLDSNSNEIASSILSAVGDWMTSLINFEANLNFISLKDQSGVLVFSNENPSGLLEKDKEFQLPVKIKRPSGETTKIKVYFNNNEMDSEFSCNKVFYTEREILKVPSIATATLQELLGGPSDAEKSQGFFSSIKQGVEIQSLIIENGVVKVDFSEQLEYKVGGSCMVSAIRAQITETLKQFPTIESVVISINGRTEDILQP